jgi:hypothetical protein
MTVHDKLDTTIGAATRSTSRPPLGRDHQESSIFVVELASIRHLMSMEYPQNSSPEHFGPR